jgi:hypothetical protein
MKGHYLPADGTEFYIKKRDPYFSQISIMEALSGKFTQMFADGLDDTENRP